MSTRARIGIVNADKSVTSIYTHSDGYIEHHGPILLNHYNTEAKIRGLLKLGNLSVLGKELGKKHDFNTQYDVYPDWCKAYKRDRGDKLELAKNKTVALFEEMCRNSDQEWMYLFNNGVWHISGTGLIKWKNLETEYIKTRLTT